MKTTLYFVYLRVSNQNIPQAEEQQNNVPDIRDDQPSPTSNEPGALQPGFAVQTPPSINEQTTPPMEVHHHGHVHERTKWKEYLFQFLMLFLAVTLGFFVENQREHYVENKRAKEFAKLLVDDLISDTSELNLADRAWKNVVIASDSLSSLIQPKKTRIQAARLYFYGYWSSWRWSVISRDATLQQLKSSGSLRYFGDISLIRKILNYEESIKLNALLQTRFDSEKAANWQVVQKVFDHSYFDTLETIKGAARGRTNSLSIPNPNLKAFFDKDIPLNTDDETLLMELKNGAETTSRNYRILISGIEYTKQKAIEAIDGLKTKYHLD